MTKNPETRQSAETFAVVYAEQIPFGRLEKLFQQRKGLMPGNETGNLWPGACRRKD